MLASKIKKPKTPWLKFVRGPRRKGTASPPPKKLRSIVLDRCTPALERARVENAIKISGKPIRNPSRQDWGQNPQPDRPPPEGDMGQ